MIKKHISSHLRTGVLALTVALSATASIAADQPAETGKFQASLDSLEQYQCPEWFRNAKFGIWAHWGPQAVPRQGDWYARKMYEPNADPKKDRHYNHHLKTWGHPSKYGYKDIIPLWKAEKFDPDTLMQLYVKAGARYFVSMGVHHDNFDLWDSKYQPRWNSVAMGPKRDIVGEWKAAASKYGLKFGVSEHLGASYTWFQTSHGADKTGPMAGVPYDGADPQWADLYHTKAVEKGWQWYTNNPEWHKHWADRITDLLDKYQPDLLYSDGGLPFGTVGCGVIAHFYNTNMARNGGKLEAVYNCKAHHKPSEMNQFRKGTGVEDVERGGMMQIAPLPWQTDTSIGDWFYADGYKYKTTTDVVHQLADIVSKNGNLLLNVVLYADGSLPPEPAKFLEEMAAWIAVNGEAIYDTRPWVVFGEGPTQVVTGAFKEKFDFKAQDIRFTTKQGALYAIAMGWPEDRKLTITSLAKDSDKYKGEIAKVELLGSQAKVTWTRDEKGLTVQLPATKPCEHAISLKITGK